MKVVTWGRRTRGGRVRGPSSALPRGASQDHERRQMPASELLGRGGGEGRGRGTRTWPLGPQRRCDDAAVQEKLRHPRGWRRRGSECAAGPRESRREVTRRACLEPPPGARTAPAAPVRATAFMTRRGIPAPGAPRCPTLTPCPSGLSFLARVGRRLPLPRSAWLAHWRREPSQR